MAKSVKTTVVEGLLWKFFERIGVQLIQFIIQVILARILLPEQFGTIAILNVFILIATSLIQYGFSTALIQKKNVDEIDYSSVLYVNLFIAAVMYMILFVCAPVLAEFYMDDQLTVLLRILSVILFLGAVSSVQNTVLTKEMNFKCNCMINLGAIIVQGIVGIVLAINGFGVWSLVLAQISNSIMLVALGFVFIKWKPVLKFSLKKIKILFAFGRNILLSTILETIFNNIYSLVIGKVYTKESLGYYNRGQSIPGMLVTTINGSIQGVMFPVLSEFQEDRKRIKGMMRRSVKTSGYLVFPVMAGIVAVAPALIPLLLTDKWNPCIPFLQLSCISMAFYPIHTTNLQAISAIGRSDIYLKVEIIKKIVLVGILLITMNVSLTAVMIGSVVAAGICTIINAWPNKRLFDYSIMQQFKDLFPSFALSAVMGAIVYAIGTMLPLPLFLVLIIQTISGVFIYILGSLIFKIDSFYYLLETIKSFLRK